MPVASRFLRLLVLAGIIVYALFSALSSWGSFHWAAELLTHFRVQAAVAGGLLALMSLALRLRAWSAVACGLTALHLFPLAPYLVPEDRSPSMALPRVRLLHVNVHTANRHHQAVVNLVAEKRPDVLALLEVNQRWLEALSSLHASYPHRIERPQNDNFGIALFSRFPIEGLRLRRLGHDGIYMILGRFSLGATPITLAVAHPVPPASPAYSALRNKQLDELSEIARDSQTDEIILLGDLNTSPWSPVYRRLESGTGLRNGARGLGIFPTWPTDFPPLMIPIDHCLLSSGLRAVSVETGPEIGSDHLPVLVEIVATQRPGAAQPRAAADGGMPRRHRSVVMSGVEVRALRTSGGSVPRS